MMDYQEHNPDRTPCPVCGVVLHQEMVGDDGGSNVIDALLSTPMARLCALAMEAGMTIEDISDDEACDLAGAVSVGFDQDGEIHGMLSIAEDLDDDLRTDILAFGIAVYVGEARRIVETPGGYVGIGRDRLPAARRGAGHLAWHMARSCGRDTPSATFDLVGI
jgi:hypothetical protein